MGEGRKARERERMRERVTKSETETESETESERWREGERVRGSRLHVIGEDIVKVKDKEARLLYLRDRLRQDADPRKQGRMIKYSRV